MEIIRKARKDHECGYCYIKIKKGEKYKEIKNRYPVYDSLEDGNQTGIEYTYSRKHIVCDHNDHRNVSLNHKDLSAI